MLRSLLLLVAAAAALTFTGCMTMPDNFDAFSRSFKAEELTVVGATPWGNQQFTAKNIEFYADALGGGTAAGGNTYVFEPDPAQPAPPASAPAAPAAPAQPAAPVPAPEATPTP